MMMKFEKKILYKGMGEDQLGKYVGTPEPGDIVKIHVRGYYVADRPLFKLGRNKKFFVKPRKVEFLDTHMIGDTAFIELPIGEPKEDEAKDDNPNNNNNIIVEMLTLAVKDMMLGESANVMFGDTALAGKRHLLSKKSQAVAGRAFYKSIPGGDEKNDGDGDGDVQSIEFDIDCFRIVRQKKEHHRPARTGPGGWAMGM